MQTSLDGAGRAGLLARARDKGGIVATEVFVGLLGGGLGMVFARLLIASAARALARHKRPNTATRPVAGMTVTNTIVTGTTGSEAA